MGRLFISDMRRAPRLLSVKGLAVFTLLMIALCPVLPESFTFMSMQGSLGTGPEVGSAAEFSLFIPDPADPGGSAVRSALFFMWLWPPVATVIAVNMAASDFSSSSLQVARARSARLVSIVISKLVSCSVYVISCSFCACLALLVTAGARLGVAIDIPLLARFIQAFSLNALLLVAMVGISLTAYYAIGSPSLAAVCVIVPFFMAMNAYHNALYNAYSMSDEMSVHFLPPSTYFMHAASLCFHAFTTREYEISNITTTVIGLYGICAIALSGAASMAFLKMREVFR